ncbi:hypothetical protein HZU75_04710 [Chitinibacter fontanus]|uniref:Uncharacterized protein n=1 Tax=Chitinibacter fontanus TaxID=1737446 RepID=A0A7D5ZBG6_9NEIS|nr:hypothetical protein [Chitinibacter fontanus]QLI80886.1 hypothetical protein HZU75_04710 [Chitinibacter fontanus]
MKKSLLAICMVTALLAATVHADPRVPDDMMRGRSSQYQEGFRDGFREAVRMMGGGNNNDSGGGWSSSGRGLRINSATYGNYNRTCDFTEALAREAEGRSSYTFTAHDDWCGNPAPGKPKNARIDYSCRGRDYSESVNSGSSKTLRCN